MAFINTKFTVATGKPCSAITAISIHQVNACTSIGAKVTLAIIYIDIAVSICIARRAYTSIVVRVLVYARSSI